MFEELRENLLALLEERVERAIHTIDRLREDKRALESQVSQFQDELKQRDTKIQELEDRNAALQHVESDLKTLQEEREQERQEIDREKAEIRERLEGLMAMLNHVNNKPEKQASAEQEEPPHAAEALEADTSTAFPSPNPPETEEPSSVT